MKWWQFTSTVLQAQSLTSRCQQSDFLLGVQGRSCPVPCFWLLVMLVTWRPLAVAPLLQFPPMRSCMTCSPSIGVRVSLSEISGMSSRTPHAAPAKVTQTREGPVTVPARAQGWDAPYGEHAQHTRRESVDGAQPAPPARCKDRPVQMRGRIGNVECVLWSLISKSSWSMDNTFPGVR